MIPHRGDLWVADLNPRAGTEPGKLRPVLIVQTDLLNTLQHPSTIVCLLTTKIQPDVELLRVHLPVGTAGLTKASDVMLDQVRVIDNQRLRKKLGHLSRAWQTRIDQRLRVILELELP